MPVVLTLMCFAVTLYASETFAAPGHWLLQAADRAENSTDVDGAIQLLRAYQQIADAPTVWLRVGRLLERKNRIAEAIDAYEKYRGEDAAVHDQLKVRLKQLHEREDAGSFSERLAESRKMRPLAERAFREGRRLVLAKKYREGIGYLQAAAMLDPTLPGSFRLLGATYLKIGRTKSASSQLAEYLRIRPDGRLADKVRRMLRGKNVLGRLEAQASFPCQLWVNGRFVAPRTPVKALLLPAGYHIVAFVSDQHHLVKTFRVKVEANSHHVVNFRYGIIQVGLEPWGRIRANGRDLGLWEKLGLPAGKYRLEVRSHGGDREAQAIWEVTAGKTRRLTWKDLS